MSAPREGGPTARTVTDIHGWAPGEWKAYRGLLFKTIAAQRAAQKDANADVPCGGCQKLVNLRDYQSGYRCFHCEVIFCAKCGVKHFGPPPGVPEEEMRIVG